MNRATEELSYEEVVDILSREKGEFHTPPPEHMIRSWWHESHEVEGLIIDHVGIQYEAYKPLINYLRVKYTFGMAKAYHAGQIDGILETRIESQRMLHEGVVGLVEKIVNEGTNS